jgi:hypothetical protein
MQLNPCSLIYPQDGQRICTCTKRNEAQFTSSVNAMHQRPSWEANSSSTSRNFRLVLWHPKFHYRVRNSMPRVHIRSQMDPVHADPSYFCKIHFNAALPSVHTSSAWSLSFALTDNNLYVPILPHVCHTGHPSRTPWFFHLNNVW